MQGVQGKLSGCFSEIKFLKVAYKLTRYWPYVLINAHYTIPQTNGIVLIPLASKQHKSTRGAPVNVLTMEKNP